MFKLSLFMTITNYLIVSCVLENITEQGKTRTTHLENCRIHAFTKRKSRDIFDHWSSNSIYLETPVKHDTSRGLRKL